MLKKISLQLIACISLSLLSSYTVYALPEEALVPGGIALLKLSEYDKNTKVYFKDKRVAVFPHGDDWFAMAGIGLSTRPGEYKLTIKRPGSENVTSKITVNYKKYDEQHLTIKNKRKVNPNKQDNQRIAAESKRKKKAKKQFTELTPEVDFIWPVTGRISSIFGLRRFFNEQERRPHSGLDIVADEGTPVKAAANGIVIDSGDFFFSGNMIYLDHGQGVISLYAHLSKIAIKPGDVVQRGDIIGNVGQTGRVTGPHLHFAIITNQTLIDPLFMLPKDGNPVSHPIPAATTKKSLNSAQN